MSNYLHDYNNRPQLVPQPEKLPSWSYVLEAPRFAKFPSWLKDAVWGTDMKLEMEVDKGWLRETVRFKVTGPQAQLDRLMSAFEETLDDYNNRGKD